MSEQVVANWEEFPEEVRGCMTEFGAFYCTMHPLVNFAEETNKVTLYFPTLLRHFVLNHSVLTEA